MIHPSLCLLVVELIAPCTVADVDVTCTCGQIEEGKQGRKKGRGAIHSFLYSFSVIGRYSYYYYYYAKNTCAYTHEGRTPASEESNRID